jgi:hypothetical protein
MIGQCRYSGQLENSSSSTKNQFIEFGEVYLLADLKAHAF